MREDGEKEEILEMINNKWKTNNEILDDDEIQAMFIRKKGGKRR